jgi:hypothetical protein
LAQKQSRLAAAKAEEQRAQFEMGEITRHMPLAAALLVLRCFWIVKRL